MSRQATRQVDRSGFALRLHEALGEAGLTTEQFAREVGVTLRTAQRWRSGESEPSAQDMSRACLRLGRPLEFFYPAENGEAA